MRQLCIAKSQHCSTYYWHEAVWSVGLLLSINSAFVDRWVELLMISCVYLNILTIEALFSPILLLTLYVVLMAMVQCHRLRKSLHQTFIYDFLKSTDWSLETMWTCLYEGATPPPMAVECQWPFTHSMNKDSTDIYKQ